MAISMAMLNYHMVAIQNFRNHPEWPSEEPRPANDNGANAPGLRAAHDDPLFFGGAEGQRTPKRCAWTQFSAVVPGDHPVTPQRHMIYFTSESDWECPCCVLVLPCFSYPEDHEANVFSSIFGWEASVTSDPAPAWCQDVKLKEELDGLKKNIANGTRTLVDIILLSWEALQISQYPVLPSPSPVDAELLCTHHASRV